MTRGSKVGIVCCSNGQKSENRAQLEKLKDEIMEMDLNPFFSDYIYRVNNSSESGSPQKKAEALMEFYKNDSIKEIYDISGGDLANSILSYLDYDVIAKSNKKFWGYSDLTSVINAIYAKTGKSSVLYQIRNLIYQDGDTQKKNFSDAVYGRSEELYQFPYEFIQGKSMNGIVVGGNVRCLLKLAGTEYFPDMTDKILFLEAYSGTVNNLIAYFSQLQQMGVFDRVAGIMLGTFTQMQEEKCSPNEIELLQRFIPATLPVAKTFCIGHGSDSKAIKIGEYYSF